MVRITKHEYQKMMTYAMHMLPEEACGLLAGQIQATVKQVQKVYCLMNILHSAERFQLDPKEQIAAAKEMRSQGMILLGNWHSHPTAPPVPSEADKQFAYDRNAVYLILSLANPEQPDLKAYSIVKNQVKAECICYETEP